MELGADGRGVGISQVVPFPWNAGVPVVREYQKLVQAKTGKEAYSFTSLEGFIAAKVMVEGLKRAGREPTRERLVAALETMNDYDVGGFTVTYTPTDHTGSRFVELTAIGKDGSFVR
jgi:ABC-type branched-subunit amino acid transport system substrate-binding protein